MNSTPLPLNDALHHPLQVRRRPLLRPGAPPPSGRDPSEPDRVSPEEAEHRALDCLVRHGLLSADERRRVLARRA